MKKLLLFTITMIAQLGAIAQWTAFPGTGQSIVCASSSELAVSAQVATNKIVFKRDFTTNTWTQMTGNGQYDNMGLGADGMLYCKSTVTLNSTSNLITFNAIPAAAYMFTPISGILYNNISVQSQYYAIGCTGNGNNNIYQRYSAGAWQLLPGSTNFAGKKVVVGNDGAIYAMNWSVGNNVYAYTSGTWTAVSNGTITATDIAVGDAGKVMAIAGGLLYYRQNGNWVLDATAPSNLARVSLATDGTIFLLTSSTANNLLTNTWQNVVCGGGISSPVNTTPSQSLSICAGQATTLTLTGNGVLNYSGPSGGSGSVIETPILNTNATYTVTRTENGCVSAPTIITVTVNGGVAPVFSGAASVSVCAGTSATLATTNTGNVSWYASLTSTTAIATGSVYTTPTLTSNTSYYISETTNGCPESPRSVKTVTVNPLPSQPVNLSSTIGLQNSVCSGNIAEFYVGTNCNWYTSATGGASFLNSNSYTTPTLTTTTTYYVDRTVNGCTSAPRVALVATVTPIPSVLSQTVQNANCNGASNGSIVLTLNNPSSFNYNWIPNVSSTYSATSLAAGIYTVNILSTNGLCGSGQTYTVNQPAVYNVPVNVLANGATLGFGNSYTGSPSFQWVDCNNSNAPIAGEINAIFTPTITGNYALTFGYGTCLNTSTCNIVTVTTTGLNENTVLNAITLQPNPASTFFTLNNVVEGTSINVMDVTGKVVISNTVIDADKTMTIEASNLSNGIYVIQLKNNGAVAHKKLIVSK